jgi:VWFA-related protein
MRSAVHRRVFLSCVAVAAFGLSAARRGVIAQTGPSTPTYPAGVDVVTVDAVVLDREGRPVPGLAREDFVVTDEGRPQEIATFEAVDATAAPPAGPAGAVDSAGVVASSSSPRPGRAYAVLLDDVSIPAADGPRARAAVTQFLERSLRSGDQVRLATTSGYLEWSAGIPEGREDLLAVISRFRTPGSAPGRGGEVFATGELEVSPREDRAVPGTGTIDPLGTMTEYQAHRIVQGKADAGPLLGRPSQSNRAIAQEIEHRRQNRMRHTHAALRRELNALATMAGRKSLLLVTQGFIRASDFEIQDTTRMALDANVAIYFLDVRGLMATPGYSADIAAAPDPTTVVGSLTELDVHDTAGSQDLASDTGGFSVRNSNDLAPGLERIAAESRVFYLLGIHPPPGTRPGAWRTLRVSVRRPGLTVRARRGYTVPTPDRARSIRAAQAGAFIPVRLASYVLEPADAETTTVTVAIDIDAAGLLPAGGPADSQLNVRLDAIARDGGAIYRSDLAVNRTAAGAHGPGREGWASARVKFALPPDVYRVRAEVEDPATGRRGVVEQRVAVPAANVFRISTPVLATAYAGASAPAPVAHRSFSASGGRPLLYAFAVLGAAKDPATERTEVTMRVAVKDRSGRALIEAPEAAVAPSPEGRLEQVIGLPLAQMAAGEYTLELMVHDRVGGGRLQRTDTFLVEAAPSPAVTADLKGPAAPGAPSVAPDLAPILERAGRYVSAYQEAFSDIVAEEDYRQELSDPMGRWNRHSRAEMVFASLPGPIPWAVFRDVYEVDGKKVRDREARLERLFQASPDGAVTAATRARAIVDESARFNLGPVRRTLNVPTFALLVLHPEHQHRFWFQRGKKPIDGAKNVQVIFAERHRPTLVAGAEGEVVARGSIWIDPDTGAVLKTDVSYLPERQDRFAWTHTRIVTEYGPEPRLQVTVPVRMTETYDAGAVGLYGGGLDEFGRRRTGFAIKAVARYSGYRRFEVTTDEEYAKPPEDQR